MKEIGKSFLLSTLLASACGSGQPENVAPPDPCTEERQELVDIHRYFCESAHNDIREQLRRKGIILEDIVQRRKESEGMEADDMTREQVNARLSTWNMRKKAELVDKAFHYSQENPSAPVWACDPFTGELHQK